MIKYTEVAVGIVIGRDGAVLFGQRPQGKPYAGWWEFPGGKLEQGESVDDALKRELAEELGIEVLQTVPWVVRTHQYAHAHVRLHFQKVIRWNGQPQSQENQALRWLPNLDSLEAVAPMLPAAWPVILWLRQPQQWLLNPALGKSLEPSAAVVVDRSDLNGDDFETYFQAALACFGAAKLWVAHHHGSSYARRCAGQFVSTTVAIADSSEVNAAVPEEATGPFEALGGYASCLEDVAALGRSGARFIIAPQGCIEPFSRVSRVPVYSWSSG